MTDFDLYVPAPVTWARMTPEEVQRLADDYQQEQIDAAKSEADQCAIEKECK